MTSGLRGSGLVEQLMGSLKWHGIEAVLYDRVESNPKDYNVMDSVALGGGPDGLA
jgi:methanol:N,N-dimethyl-4-nitrosoaniline oxidoreductase